MRLIRKYMSMVLVFLVVAAMLIGCGSGTASVTQTADTENVSQETILSEDETEESLTGEDEDYMSDEVSDGQTDEESQVLTEEAADDQDEEAGYDQDDSGSDIDEDGTYTSKEDVALYIHTYGKLPSNYITKKEAQAEGWDSKEGNLDEVLPGMSIGGDKFGNYEGLLPKASGRKYYECDIDYDGGYRDAKRIIFSNDGLVFYTEDHYKTFEQLY